LGAGKGSRSDRWTRVQEVEKEAKKLRRALQPVRDTDVYLAKLDGLRAFPNGATDGKPQLSSRCLRGSTNLKAGCSESASRVLMN